MPKRTDTLAAGGYIVKQSVTSHELGCTTALCTLKRFAREAKVGKELVVRNVGGGGGARGGDVIKDGVMYYGPFLDYIVKSFGQRDLVTLTELKRGLVSIFPDGPLTSQVPIAELFTRASRQSAGRPKWSGTPWPGSTP